MFLESAEEKTVTCLESYFIENSKYLRIHIKFFVIFQKVYHSFMLINFKVSEFALGQYEIDSPVLSERDCDINNGCFHLSVSR